MLLHQHIRAGFYRRNFFLYLADWLNFSLESISGNFSELPFLLYHVRRFDIDDAFDGV